MNDKEILLSVKKEKGIIGADGMHDDFIKIALQKARQDERIKWSALINDNEKFIKENAELRKQCDELLFKTDREKADLYDKIFEWKSRWEKLKEYFISDQCHDCCWTLKEIQDKMHELESGSSIPKAGSGHSLIPPVEPRTRTGKPHNSRVSGGEGDTHREQMLDSLSLCLKCGCMTKTIHDEEIMERCGKCGIEKSGGESCPNGDGIKGAARDNQGVKSLRTKPKPGIEAIRESLGKPDSKKGAGT
jgi:hypothetical protein